MDTEALKLQIEEGAREIDRLQAQVHETFGKRGQSRAANDEWSAACREFHERYDQLAFPDGYDGAEARIAAGDALTIEAALCFLEMRPYFFRSGYMYQSLLRKMKRASFTREQWVRMEEVLRRVEEWKKVKQSRMRSNRLFDTDALRRPRGPRSNLPVAGQLRR